LRTLRIYLALFAQMLKVRLAYRGDFLADLFATALGGLASLFTVLLLFNPISNLHGWTKPEVLFVAGLSMMSYGLFATVSWNLFEFGDRYIIEGRFDRVLLRPISTWAQVIFDQFRIPVLSETLIGAWVVGHATHQLGLDLSAGQWAFVGLTAISGMAIYVFVFSMLASVSFHFEDRIGVAPPVFNLIPFGRWPQEIFPWPIVFLLRWLIPFGFVAFYPSTALLGKSDVGRGGIVTTLAILSPIVALAFGLLNAFLWRLGVRRYESTGS
jgi:ABC-2 type transport system permease protein